MEFSPAEKFWMNFKLLSIMAIYYFEYQNIDRGRSQQAQIKIFQNKIWKFPGFVFLEIISHSSTKSMTFLY